MNEIKFKFWDIENKRFFKPMYEAYSGKLDDLLIGIKGDILRHTTNGIAMTYDEFILLQYTGLRDKDGKEIYEGDIVQMNISNVIFDFGVVTFGKFNAGIYDCYGWYVSLNDEQTSEAGLHEGFEIIGNIYENPELLTKTK